MKTLYTIALLFLICSSCTHSRVEDIETRSVSTGFESPQETDHGSIAEVTMSNQVRGRGTDSLSEQEITELYLEEQEMESENGEAENDLSNPQGTESPIQELKDELQSAFIDKNVFYSSSSKGFVYPFQEVTVDVPPGVSYVELGRSVYADLSTFEQYGLGGLKALTDLSVDQSPNAGKSISPASGSSITFYSLSALGLQLVDFTDVNRLSTHILQGDIVVKIHGHNN